MASLADKNDLTMTSDEEILAQDLLQRGEIDQAIAAYQHLDLNSVHVLRIIGVLYAEKKGDYQSAINYYMQALEIQEKNGDDISDSLTELGFACQNLLRFDLALDYHLRALSIRQLADDINQKAVATSLLGIANAYWGEQNLSKALRYAQEALILNESVTSDNDPNIAANLAILANIYHHCGDDIYALDLAKRALILLERYVSSDSLTLLSLLNNIGTIQFSVGQFSDALVTFSRVLHLCERTLPVGHPKRVIFVQNIERLAAMEKYNVLNLSPYFWSVLTKFLLL